jgi:dipeptidyl aminopeptidase/acylaminoacyl peptidase
VEPDRGRIRTADVSRILPKNVSLTWTGVDRLRYVTVSGDRVQLKEFGPYDLEPALLRQWPFETTLIREAVLSPEGTRFILPAMTPTSLNFELYLFDLNSDEVRNLSNRPVHNDTNPVWSPNGKHILFRSLNDAGQFLVTMTVDHLDQTTLYRLTDALIHQALWSPDGRRVSFLAAQSGRKQLCLIDLADTSLNCPVRDTDHITWRPAG